MCSIQATCRCFTRLPISSTSILTAKPISMQQKSLIPISDSLARFPFKISSFRIDYIINNDNYWNFSEFLACPPKQRKVWTLLQLDRLRSLWSIRCRPDLFTWSIAKLASWAIGQADAAGQWPHTGRGACQKAAVNFTLILNGRLPSAGTFNGTADFATLHRTISPLHSELYLSLWTRLN